MARMAGFVVPGLPHHLMQRGNGGAGVFFSDADYGLLSDIPQMDLPSGSVLGRGRGDHPFGPHSIYVVSVRPSRVHPPWVFPHDPGLSSHGFAKSIIAARANGLVRPWPWRDPEGQALARSQNRVRARRGAALDDDF
jgi:hypothetical protein